MKDYSAMSDLEINKAVAAFKPDMYYVSDDGEPVYLEVDPAPAYTGSDYNEVVFDPCNNPADAWPIILANNISILSHRNGLWQADNQAYWVDGDEWQIDGQVNQNPLRAAMIVYLQMMEAQS